MIIVLLFTFMSKHGQDAFCSDDGVLQAIADGTIGSASLRPLRLTSDELAAALDAFNPTVVVVCRLLYVEICSTLHNLIY